VSINQIIKTAAGPSLFAFLQGSQIHVRRPAVTRNAHLQQTGINPVAHHPGAVGCLKVPVGAAVEIGCATDGIGRYSAS
jgi:hypothetical protein